MQETLAWYLQYGLGSQSVKSRREQSNIKQLDDHV